MRVRNSIHSISMERRYSSVREQTDMTRLHTESNSVIEANDDTASTFVSFPVTLVNSICFPSSSPTILEMHCCPTSMMRYSRLGRIVMYRRTSKNDSLSFILFQLRVYFFQTRGALLRPLAVPPIRDGALTRLVSVLVGYSFGWITPVDIFVAPGTFVFALVLFFVESLTFIFDSTFLETFLPDVAPMTGFVASGFVASGFVASGFVASGFVASGFVASGFVASGFSSGFMNRFVTDFISVVALIVFDTPCARPSSKCTTVMVSGFAVRHRRMRIYTEYAHMSKARVPHPIMSASSHVSSVIVAADGDEGDGYGTSLDATLVRIHKRK